MVTMIEEDSKEQAPADFANASANATKIDFTQPAVETAGTTSSVSWVVPHLALASSENADEQLPSVDPPATASMNSSFEASGADSAQEDREVGGEDREDDEEVRELQKKFTASIVRSN